MTKKKSVIGFHGELIGVGDGVIDIRPDGQRGIVTGIVDGTELVTVRIAQASYDITVAGRYLRIEAQS